MQALDNHHPEIAISACLLGQPVRFDGGHKRDRFITDKLSQVLDFLPICPEMESGMQVPRPTVHLRRINGEMRLTQSNDGEIDHTDNIQSVARKRASELQGRISGFIVQKKSPSCGMERVKVTNTEGNVVDHKGVGLFTQHFMQLCPLVPVEEDGRLNDPVLRENFLERVYALDRWYHLDEDNITEFINFHAQHKLMLMARGKSGYATLGRIVSGVTKHDLKARKRAYITLFMQTLAQRVSRNHHYNVLQHIMGYFKHSLNNDDKKELLEVMQSYKLFHVPLATPITLLKHYLRKYPDNYLAKQHYLKPYPDALALRALV